MEDYIGKYVKQFESGNLGSLALGSCGNDWGLSCGSYQLTLRWGNCIKFLKKYFPNNTQDLYFNSSKDFASLNWPGEKYCSSPDKVKQVWTQCYNLAGERTFFQYEHEYIKSTYYDQIKAKLKDEFNIDTSRAWQECFWSWSIARGINGCYNEFKECTKWLNIKKISNNNLLDLIYNYRYKLVPHPRYQKDNMNGEREILRHLLSSPGLTDEITNSKGVQGMKYNETNKPLVCMMTNSTCYKETYTLNPVGILWHSTGCNNPTLKRYVQPSDNDPNYKELINLIGKNKYNNDINHLENYYGGGLNAWIGKLADGSVTTLQTMPWNYRPWGCGKGYNGSCNNGWIQFEICEDNLQNADYFNQIYCEAIQLSAYLCKLYGFDPYGYVIVNGKQIPVITCHSEAHSLGMAHNHGDVMHWFPKYGKNMNTIREDIAALLAEDQKVVPVVPDNGCAGSDECGCADAGCSGSVSNNQEGDEEMTQEKFNEMMNVYLLQLAKQPANNWSKEALAWAQSNGLLNGDENGNLMPRKFLTREEFATVLERYNKKF